LETKYSFEFGGRKRLRGILSKTVRRLGHSRSIRDAVMEMIFFFFVLNDNSD